MWRSRTRAPRLPTWHRETSTDDVHLYHVVPHAGTWIEINNDKPIVTPGGGTPRANILFFVASAFPYIITCSRRLS